MIKLDTEIVQEVKNMIRQFQFIQFFAELYTVDIKDFFQQLWTDGV